MKKKVLVVILIVIVIVLAIVGYFVFSDMRQEGKLKTELSELEELVNAETIDMDAINERLDRIVTTGDYAVVEDAFKSYLRENFDNSIQIAEILNDERLTTLLTVENYQEDGKDFIESKNYITTTREKLENCKTAYKEFFTEEKAMSYINNKGLDSYYTDLYKEELVGDVETAGSDYYTAYGVFIKGESSCAGCTRALGMVLEEMGYSWKHVNENQWTHQWVELTMDGQVGYADGQVGLAGYGTYPFM